MDWKTKNRGETQPELDQLFAHLRNRANAVRVLTAQEFYQARYRISARVFGDLNQERIRLVEEHLPIPRWQDLRLVAADGSAVRLTLTKKGVRSILPGVAFGLYRLVIEVFLDFRLHEPLSNERQMLFAAIESLRSDDVLLLDPGFPCRWPVAGVDAHRTRDPLWYSLRFVARIQGGARVHALRTKRAGSRLAGAGCP